ncbi:response regulator transcription factor [Parachryseolinea silvisoli]|uniref:response regulator transcription factor n=1 Tax=Parachryseolinea silvisoli TaxID=2873601 RepID=UPI002265EA87|nr:response regulator transcription factor [Parachryseolinea silvisoli]MCD9017087.1 response regulator transcription factor [Parachryseolinea silvisoli]
MSQPDNTLHIAMVEDHPVVIEGLRRILAQEMPHATLLEFHTGDAFLQHLRGAQHVVTLALLDITLPDTNGVELCQKVKSQSPDTCVLGFSNHNDRALIMQMLSSGASGYLLKNVSARELMQCVREALSGQMAFSDEIKKIIAKPSAAQVKAVPPLTKREKQILRLIADGKTSADIAAELLVSPFTIETHRRNLMQKFDVNNAAALIRLAAQLQLI